MRDKKGNEGTWEEDERGKEVRRGCRREGVEG